MNKTLKLSLLGTLAASSTLAVALPIVSCSNVIEEEKENKNELIASVEEDNIKKVNEIYNAQMSSKTTYDSQKELYDSWVTNATLTDANSPAIEELKTTLSFKDINEEDVSWDIAVEKLIYAPKIGFPINGDTNIPPVIIKIILNEDYFIKDPSKLSITINNLGEVINQIPPNLKLTSTLNEAKIKEVKDKYKESIQKGITTYQQQKAVYDKWIENDILTNTNSPAFTQLKETITFKDANGNDAAFENVIKNLTYGPKIAFPEVKGAKIPTITIKIDIREEYQINGDLISTIVIDDLGDLVANIPSPVTVEIDALNELNQRMVKRAYKEQLQDTSENIEQQRIVFNSWKNNVTSINTPSIEIYRMIKEAILTIKDNKGGTILQFSAIERWEYSTTANFPSTSGQKIPAITLTAILKPKYTTSQVNNLIITISDLGNTK